MEPNGKPLNSASLKRLKKSDLIAMVLHLDGRLTNRLVARPSGGTVESAVRASLENLPIVPGSVPAAKAATAIQLASIIDDTEDNSGASSIAKQIAALLDSISLIFEEEVDESQGGASKKPKLADVLRLPGTG